MEVGVRELRARLGHWLEVARRGEEVVVTDRGRPVARLVGASGNGAMDRLIAQGVVRLPRAQRRPSGEIRRVRSEGSVAELVSDQRR
jgi:prevent-host-death family protein